MNNLFNGENELLANTVNKFLNDHGQEVLKEVKPAIRCQNKEKFWRVWKASPLSPAIFRDQLRNLVTRVMNDAFSSLPADQLLNNLVRLEITNVLLVETWTYPGQPVRVTLRLPLDSNQCQPDFQRTTIFTFPPMVPLRLSNRGS